MTPHDLKTLSECIAIMRETKSKIYKKARHIRDKNARDIVEVSAFLFTDRANSIENLLEKWRKSNEPA